MPHRHLSALSLLAAALAVVPAWGQPVPVGVQARTLVRIFDFDRALGDRAALRVLIPHLPEGREEAQALAQAFGAVGLTAEALPASSTEARLQPGVVLYLLPATASADLLKAAVANSVLTVSGDASLAEQGKVSVGLRGTKPDIVVNRDRAAIEGHEFDSALMRIARGIGSGSGEAPGGPVAPRLIGFKQPEYPALARRFRIEGEVVVRLAIDDTGRVVRAEVVRGVGRGNLDEAALAAARSATFHPAVRNGVRVPSTFELKIPFKL